MRTGKLRRARRACLSVVLGLAVFSPLLDLRTPSAADAEAHATARSETFDQPLADTHFGRLLEEYAPAGRAPGAALTPAGGGDLAALPARDLLRALGRGPSHEGVAQAPAERPARPTRPSKVAGREARAS